MAEKGEYKRAYLLSDEEFQLVYSWAHRATEGFKLEDVGPMYLIRQRVAMGLRASLHDQRFATHMVVAMDFPDYDRSG